MIEIPCEHRDLIRRAIYASDFVTMVRFERRLGYTGGEVCRMTAGPVQYGLAYVRRFLDEIRDHLGLDIPCPPPSIRSDSLDALLKAGRIRQPEHDAGVALRAAADDYEFPGLWPSRDLLAAWPPRLRAMFLILRGADVEAFAVKPPLPTPSSTVWACAVDDELPAVLGLLPRSPMARAQMASLRIGLGALAAALPALMKLSPEPERAHADDLRSDGEAGIDADQRSKDTDQVRRALELLKTLPRHQVRDAVGMSLPTMRWLDRLRSERPELLADVVSGKVTIYAAALEAGMVKKRESTATGAHKGRAPTWPPQNPRQQRLYERVREADPELAARVERCELSITAAARTLGFKSHGPKRDMKRITPREAA